MVKDRIIKTCEDGFKLDEDMKEEKRKAILKGRKGMEVNKMDCEEEEQDNKELLEDIAVKTNLELEKEQEEIALNIDFSKWKWANIIEFVNYIRKNHLEMFVKIYSEFEEWRRGN